MSSALGRFISPDPKLTGVPFPKHLVQPQLWNMYSYTINNPLKYIDPKGEDIEIVVTFDGEYTDEEKKKIIKAMKAVLTKLDIGDVVVRNAKDEDKRTKWQKTNDFFSGPPDFAKITFTDKEGNKHLPDKVFSSAFNKYREDTDIFANANADAALHEILAHQLRLGADPKTQQFDLLGTDFPNDPYFGPRRGYLYDSNPNNNPKTIRKLYPDDQKAIEKRLKPIHRKYEE